jgi:hypothetical protein
VVCWYDAVAFPTVKNIGAVPGTLFIYFVISLTIHTLFFLGMFSCWVFFLPELGK